MDIADFVKQLNSVVTTSAAVTSTTPIPLMPFAAATPGSVESTPTTVTKTIKILIVSTHVNQVNGYSKVIYNIINQLATQPWINIVHFGTQKMMNADLGRKYPTNVKVIDASALEKQKQLGFALAELPGVIMSERPDIVFIYNDLSMICGYIGEIRKVIQNRFFKIWAYVDMVYSSQPQSMIDIITRDVERIFCFTREWKESMKSQGITRPVDVITHGIDPKMFRPIPRDLARQTIGLPKEVFLFTSLNRNIPRKRLDLLVMSFVKLIVRFPTKPLFLLIVADKGDKGGYQLFDIFSRELKLAGAAVEAFGNRLLITSKDTCYSDEDINLLYNCADVGISCAEGEGYGLCTFEQMATGVPQIVPNIGGHKEYCTENNSILVSPKMRYYIPQAHNAISGEAHIVDPEDVARAMERYAFDDDLRRLHGKLGRDTAISYTWDKCCTTLVKRLSAALQEDDE